MGGLQVSGSYHNSAILAEINDIVNGQGSGQTAPGTGGSGNSWTINYTEYDFQNFWHPFVGDLIQKLNQDSIAGMLSPDFLGGPTCIIDYVQNGQYSTPYNSPFEVVTIEDGRIDTALGEPYANYNWELLYHIPVMVAVHLSNNQYFAEAQKWFHLVFDPTTRDTTLPIPDRYWKSFVFNSYYNSEASDNYTNINTLLGLLSSTNLTGPMLQARNALITGYNAIMANPFKPHVVARTRPSAYQWYVVMKYLDNLIAWGDSLFLRDTVETLNEATLYYIQAHKLLGPAPQQMPQQGTASPRNFLQLKQAGLDRMSNTMIDLEAQFPFNTTAGPATGTSPGSNAGAPTGDQSGVLFGIGHSLYFCIPPNQKLLGYWDIVADRLFKIRNSENIQGIVQQLPLFDPPLDPGMLVQAAAAGIDISSIVSGLNQPTGPLRSPLLIQKALEIAAEVRSLGGALLAAYEKGDAEQLAQLRQGHEIALQQLVQTSRFLQWQHAKETTRGLLKSRAATYERYSYYLRLLNLTPDTSAAPQDLPTPSDDLELTEDNFDSMYSTLVGQYDHTISELAYNAQQAAQGTSPASSSGATGTGQMYLNEREDTELNTLLPQARDYRTAANISNVVAGVLTPIPTFEAQLAFWGIGIKSKILDGQALGAVARIAADVLNTLAAYQADQAGIASKTAGYQRRADEWTYQANLAAKELMATGRQILASLLGEQIARHDYQTAKTQVQQARDVQTFLQNKFTSADFYAWMQGDLNGLYYQYYRFACDTARTAEATMKHELMRPELDSTTFIQYDYWDAGHQGLLSGEKLYLDIKQMEMAYHQSNKRELEITRHVSVRQLDPLALITLRITGSCTFTVPEWLYDWDCPGHYMRRIKTVAVSMPSVTSPYTSLNCTLTLLNSTLRTSALLANGAYGRDTSQDDDRFSDYFGSTDVIVTSSGSNDSGMFETTLRDERFLPFEGAGAISTWQLSLPTPLRDFDYSTISDAILHIRYTARPGGQELATQAIKELVRNLAPGQTNSTNGSTTITHALLFCLRYDFPTEWAAFVNSAAGGKPPAPFTATMTPQLFPYAVQYAIQTANPGSQTIQIDAVGLYADGGDGQVTPSSQSIDIQALTDGLNPKPGAPAQATLTLQSDNVMVPNQTQQVFVVIQYSFTVQT
jgi:hypothetical protein